MEYSKETQLRGHRKKSRTRNKRPKKNKKKPEIYKGRSIPSAKQRGMISKKEYTKAIETFGDCCAICGNPYIEMHHIRFRSQQGRGKYRNLIPLCKIHHEQAHKDRNFAEKLKEERERIYGPWYWADKWDLFKAGMIQNTTDIEFEKFMTKEEEKCMGQKSGG